ncbi:MAG: aminobenzoyl-glutamate utilization protein [Clostridiales bacterium]|nr:aminobenzoyl-glutamate utilization protein [Clostridiales bacterium]
MAEKRMERREWTKQALAGLAPELLKLHHEIWAYAEPSSAEVQSAKLLCEVLRQKGFTVEENICGRPTAFIATFGAGHPVVGYLGEYDALPGLSQQAGLPRHCPVSEGGYGHGCGHSALGTASLAAALLAQQYLQTSGQPGTVIYYGCAAEEGEGVKPLMARDGYFDATDCVFAWHPGSTNGVVNMEMIAVKTAHIAFKGITAHAGGAPHLGRSALDACELMNVGVNYLREHVIQEARLQYAYLDCGGTAPNVVQDHAKLIYGVRAPKTEQAAEIMQRVVDCANGAALMTGTTVEVTPRMGYSDLFQNKVVASILNSAAQQVGAPAWTEADFVLAKQFTDQYTPAQQNDLQQTVQRLYGKEQLQQVLEKPLDTKMEAFDETKMLKIYGCSDVGDVGYVTPTASLSVATGALGTPGHSWFMTGMTGSSIGEKGLLCAGEIMGLAGVMVYDDPARLEGAQKERLERTGGAYHCPMYV